jgi:hypothetical protein
MLRNSYLAIGLAILTLYGVVAFTGWEPGTPARAMIPGDVRNSPGGYRSFHFWHAGFHGGK